MKPPDLPLDAQPAVDRLLRFLSVEGTTGQEKAIAEEVIAALTEAGIPRRAIHFDRANEQIPLPTQTGNLIVTLPGTMRAPCRLFLTHLDTVPLCAGAKPVRRGNRIVAAGETALGGDNRTGVACLVSLAVALQQYKLPHPPLTLLFTVREESGLWGARYVETSSLGDPGEAYNVDGRSPAELSVGATGAERWEVDIHGRAAHAGVHPEQGISATMVAAIALAEIHQKGWFGKVTRNGRSGTSNIGVFGSPDGRSAGDATNVVTDAVRLRGESRSHDSSFCREITAAYRDAFRAAAGHVRDDRGRTARVKFRARREYYPFRLKPTLPVVRRAVSAVEGLGMQPILKIGNGGLDANWLVRHGIPTVTFGAGQNGIHAVGEYVDIADYLAGCRLALALATMA